MDIIIVFALLLGGAAILIVGVEKMLTKSQPQRHALAELEYFDVVPDQEGAVLGPIVGTTEWGGLFVESGPMSVIVVLLPVIDATSRRRIPDAGDSELRVETLIAMPHPDGGHLWRDEVATRFGVAGHDVFTVGENFTGPIESDSLSVQQHPSGLRIAWDGGERAMVIGHELQLTDLIDDEPLTRILGSLAEFQDLTAEGVNQVLARLRRVDVLGNVPPANAETALYRAGIDEFETFVTVDHPADYDRGVDFGVQWLFREITAGRWDALEAGRDVVATSCFANLVLELILADRLDDALRVADFGYQHVDAAQFAFDRGVLASMRGRLDEARDWFQEALEEDPDFREAEICAASIDEPTHAVGLLVDFEAREAEAWMVPADAPVEPSGQIDPSVVAIHLSGLAHYAVLRADTFIDEESFEDAEGLLRRAIDLDPRSTVAVCRLGETLVAAGRVEEAMKLFDSAADRSVSRARVEQTRGRCLEDLRRYADAAAAYERALESAPDWKAARFDAIAVYAALANRSRGEAHIDYLAKHSDLDDQELDELRAQFSR